MIRHMTWLKTITLIILVLLVAVALMAQPTETTFAGFTPAPPKPTPGGGDGGGGGGDGGEPKDSKIPAESPLLILPTATPAPEPPPTATPAPEPPPAALPETGGVPVGETGASSEGQRNPAWVMLLEEDIYTVGRLAWSALTYLYEQVEEILEGRLCVSRPEPEMQNQPPAKTDQPAALRPYTWVRWDSAVQQVPGKRLPPGGFICDSSVASPGGAPGRPWAPQAVPDSGTGEATRALPLSPSPENLVEFPAIQPQWVLLWGDDFSTLPMAWQINQTPLFGPPLSGSALALSVDRSQAVAWAQPSQIFEGGILVAVDAVGQESPGPYSYSLLIGLRDTDNFHELEIASSGSFTFWEMSGGQLKALVGPLRSSAIHGGSETNRLNILAHGPVMILGVNGYQLAAVVASAPPVGDIGFVVRGDGINELTVLFDNAEVRSVQTGYAPAAPSGRALPAFGQEERASSVPSVAPAVTSQPETVSMPTPTGNSPTSTATPVPVREPVVPEEWMPPPGKASLLVFNESNGDIVFTMGDQERRMPPHTRAIIFREPGLHGYTATDPRFEPYHDQCSFGAGGVYYWYTDDSMVSDDCRLVEW